MSSETVIGYVYVVTNAATGKQYVGQTTGDPAARWKCHVKEALRHRAHGCRALHAAIRKYGSRAFSLTWLRIEGVNQEQLDRAESDTIARLSTLVPDGYNLKSGGAGGRHHEVSRARMSAAHRALPPFSAQHIERLRAAKVGSCPPAKAIENAAASKRGRPLSESHKARLRAAWKHRSPATPETRARLSEAARRRVVSDETKAAIGAALKGRKLSPDHVAKLKASHTGRPWSPAQRAAHEARKAS